MAGNKILGYGVKMKKGVTCSSAQCSVKLPAVPQTTGDFGGQ